MGRRDWRRRRSRKALHALIRDCMRIMASDKANSRTGHKWRPIEGIGSAMSSYDFQEIDSLQRQWLHVKSSVESAAFGAYKEFAERLTRSWAIETGIIEGVYDLDMDATETLVGKGIAVDYIKRGSTNKEPSELAAILIDHQDAVEAVNSWIREGHPLTKWFIKFLHSQILRKQDTSRAMNQFGNMFDAEIVKGEFKKHPNNPIRPDGTIHEYCPPEQVESELDKLLELYNKYDSADCHPLLLAAWLHHRFEQIHPFQDGNGRVGRAVLTWHLVRKEFFPVVVSRDDRTDYIDALENADAGDLTDLIDLFVDLEKSAILQAISAWEIEPSESAGLQSQVDSVEQVVDSIVERVQRRRRPEAAQMRSVNDIAQSLRGKASEYLRDISQSVKGRLAQADIYVEPETMEGEADQSNGHWYRVQVIETAYEFRHWVNLNEPRYFAQLRLNAKDGRTPSLAFVVSLHHTGRHLTGVMAATAFAEVGYADELCSHSGDSVVLENTKFKACAAKPFTFTSDDSSEEIADRFVRWTEECFGAALRHWGLYVTQSAE